MSLQLQSVEKQVLYPTQVGKKALPIKPPRPKPANLIQTLGNSPLLFVLPILPLMVVAYTNFELGQPKEPLRISRTINVESWIEALTYSEGDRQRVITSLLREYDIEPTVGMSEWLTKMFDEMIISYERDYKVSLSYSKKRVLSNLALKISSDMLHFE